MRIVLSACLLYLSMSVSAQGIGNAGLSGDMHSATDMSSNVSIFAAIASPVSGQPYEARKMTSSVWHLADGTVIAHNAESQIARDSEGRIREEVAMTHAGSLGGKQMNHTSESVTIGDPVDHSLIIWTGDNPKIAMRMELPNISGIHSKGVMGGVVSSPPPPSGVARRIPKNDPTKDEVRTEDLGKQSISGVLATGKRTTTVIPTGKIGNDRPITVVHEEWYSPDLQIVLKSLDSDPRTGERTVELQGLTRGDPSPALFHAPDGVKVTDMGDMLKTLGNLGRKDPAK